MKTKSLYIIAASLLFTAGLGVAQTQTPTSPTSQPTPGTNYNTVNPSYGSQINSSAIPDPLRSTLQGNQQYKGWENGQLYFNSSTNQYSLQMPSLNTGTSTNPLGTSPAITPALPTTPTSPVTSPTSPITPTSPVSPPNSPNPMGGLQTTSPTSPVTTPPSTWYRFDQNGKLIPQTNPKPDNQ